nr:hypothetical protein Iba_chr11dCG10880 [Ipomoea batatas]
MLHAYKQAVQTKQNTLLHEASGWPLEAVCYIGMLKKSWRACTSFAASVSLIIFITLGASRTSFRLCLNKRARQESRVLEALAERARGKFGDGQRA